MREIIRSALIGPPFVSIVILNFNGGKDILECLESVERLDYPGFEVIVVDNGSTDDSLRQIKKRFTGITIVENRTNLGVPEGYNTGIRKSAAPYILLLNDDAVVNRDVLRELVAASQSDPDCGIAGPAIMYYEHPENIWWAGSRISPLGYASHTRKGTRFSACGLPRPTEYICGCAMLVKREVIARVGLLDPEYFAYFEDADYGYRARKAGYTCVYVPSPGVRHKTGPEWITNPLQAELYMRNALLFARKNLKGWRKISFMAGQFVFMLPYYSLKAAGKGPFMVKYLVRGLKEGLYYRRGRSYSGPAAAATGKKESLYRL